MDNCKKGLWSRARRRGCHRKAVKDGYCRQHHPDRLEEKQATLMRRIRHEQKVAELEAEVSRLGTEILEIVEGVDWLCIAPARLAQTLVEPAQSLAKAKALLGAALKENV